MMTDRGVREAIKSLSDEQLTKEVEIFTAFTRQFPYQFLDLFGLRYWRFLQEEANEREQRKRIDNLARLAEETERLIKGC